MLKRFFLLMAAVAMTASLAFADKEEAKFDVACLVSGAAAKKENVVEVPGGKKLYFCCENCPKAYKADPKKFAVKANLQLLETAQITQVGCPFSGKAVAEGTQVSLGKAKVGFCCMVCKGKAEKAGADLAKMVFDKFDNGFTLQTTCPISDKVIKAEHVVEHKGKKVYFCCPGCPDGFKADPDKHLAKLPQFAKQ